LDLDRARFIQKLNSLPSYLPLLVITSQEKRIPKLFKYASQALENPEAIFFSSCREVIANGLTKSSWMRFPDENIVNLRI
jgi:hypothetical protein